MIKKEGELLIKKESDVLGTLDDDIDNFVVYVFSYTKLSIGEFRLFWDISCEIHHKFWRAVTLTAMKKAWTRLDKSLVIKPFARINDETFDALIGEILRLIRRS